MVQKARQPVDGIGRAIDSRGLGWLVPLGLVLVLGACGANIEPDANPAFESAESDKDILAKTIASRSDSRLALPGKVYPARMDGTGSDFGFRSPRMYSRPHGNTMADYEAIAAGDFNGDGRADLVALTNNNTVDLFLQRQDGTLSPALIYPYGTENYSSSKILVTQDFNEDGITDVAFHTVDGYGVSGGVGILASRKGSAPEFVQGYPETSYESTASVVSWATLDADGDGHQDMIVARNYNDCGHYVVCPNYQVLHGDGAGGFGRSAIVNIPFSSPIFELVSEDINTDGFSDLVFVMSKETNGEATTSDVLVAYRLAAGGMTPPQLLLSTEGRDHLYFGDIDGNGRRDAVMGSEVHLRSWSGEFGEALYLHTYFGYPITPFLYDFDGDGFTDLVNHQFQDFVSNLPFFAIYMQRAGTLQAPFRVYDPAVRYAFKVPLLHRLPYAAADLNSDGCSDLAVAAGYDGIAVLDGFNCSLLPTGGNLPPLMSPGKAE